MILTIPYPNIDPVFLHLGPVQLRWYGLMYMLSFIIGFFVIRRLAKYRKLNLSTDDIYDLQIAFDQLCPARPVLCHRHSTWALGRRPSLPAQ